MNLKELNPAVDRKILIALAGGAWSAVGTLLLSYSVKWLTAYPGNPALFIISGILAGIIIHFFGFSRIASKNLNRLIQMSEKRCLFSFITWKSYLIIPVMMVMGITMRNSQLPKQYLSVIYTGIGLGLLISGLNYFRHLYLLVTETLTKYH